jgi:hypothetical protein
MFSSGVKCLQLIEGVQIHAYIFKLPHGPTLGCTNGALECIDILN